ncbi:phage minor head protein [Thauera sp.]|uniref:phage minor head protein n=1 Tax=Thauera sp. TaxID=1905334 RepID=UPI0039E29624
MTPTQAALAALKGRSDLINATAAELRQLLEEADQAVLAILAAAPTDYQTWYLPQLRAEIRRVLVALGDEAAAAVDAGEVNAWRAGSALVNDVVAAAGVRTVLPAIDVQQLVAMRAFLTEKMRDVAVDALNAINGQLGLVVIGAQTPFDAIKRISKTLKADSYNRARTIVHTELGRAFSTANQIRMEQSAAVVPGLKKRWLKSGKREPRATHLAIHGQEQPVDKPFVLEGGAVTMMYPHDPTAPARHTINCGCAAVPVVPGWKRTIKDPDADEVERGQQALKAATRAGPQGAA